MLVRSFVFTLYIFSCALTLNCNASEFKVVFLNPGNPESDATGDFWPNVSLFMLAAAKQLDVELEIIYANRNHIYMKSLGRKIIKKKPNYVILVNEKDVALQLFRDIAAEGIPVFMLLNTFTSDELVSLSENQLTLLEGSVIPNNYLAGKKLLTGLAQLYKKRYIKNSESRQINILALQGDYTTPASIQRNNGLVSALGTNKKLRLVDSRVANWSKQEAYEKTKGILYRERIDIIWAANDPIAYGAKKAILESKVNYPVVVGGMNWDVADATYPINLSLGGHVTLGALAIVMLKDIRNNHLALDKRHQVIDIFESSSSPYFSVFKQRLNSKQVEQYDYKKFANSNATKLNFTIKNLSTSYKD